MKAPAKRAKSATRSTYHHGDLPRALRQAAKSLLAAGGAEALTLREAARIAGVNHRAVYRHYEDKRALLAALAEEGFDRLTAKLRAAVSRVPAADIEARLLAISVEYLRFAQQNTALFRLMFGPRLNEDGRFPSLEVSLARALALVIGEMEQGAASGRLRPGSARDRAIALWSLVHGYADLVLQKRIRVRDAAIARRYLRDVFAPFLAGLAGRRD